MAGRVRSIALRVLGVVLGFTIVVMAPTILVENGRYAPWDILSCLGMLCVGGPFPVFGITGDESPRVVPRSAAWWASILVGLSFVAAGIYALTLDERRSLFRIILAVLALPLGASFVWLGVIVRRHRVRTSRHERRSA